jgi:uncharacterized membrane protein YecN with MAPEG domain
MSVTPPIISGLTAGVLLAMQLVLMFMVSSQRVKNQQSLGDGDNPALLQAVRRHGNFAENAAIFIAAVALLELLGDSRLEVEILCAAFVVGRLLHAIGMSVRKTVNRWRFFGTIIFALAGFVVAGRLVLLGIAAL